MKTRLLILSALVAIPLVSISAEQVFITEFMAANSGIVRDQDGDSSDWLEIYNAGIDTVNLAGWHLTDDLDALTKWTFPATNVGPGAFLLVFASGKDRAVAGAELHTSFQLDNAGEYLALVRPDSSIAHQFIPVFPAQQSDLSYGVVLDITTNHFLADAQPMKWLVPTTAMALPANWAATNFDDSAWMVGQLGFGFDGGTAFGPLIRTDVAAVMRDVNASAFLRIPFTYDTEELPIFDTLMLRVRYDDGFVAYLNGFEIARRNAPALPSWNSTATGERADETVLLFEDIDVTITLPLLQDGTNILAIQALNVTGDEEDLLFAVDLVARSLPALMERYFATPTPGGMNAASFLGAVGDTKFSMDRGFYDVPFSVTITSATPGVTIRCTLDGSMPTLLNGFSYSNAIPVTNTTTLRAAAFKNGYQPSDVDTQTYIFIEDVVHQTMATATNRGFPSTWPATPADYAMDTRVIGPGDLYDGKYAATIRDDLKAVPSLSIVMNMNDLFSATNGIYVNSIERGLAWERLGSLEVIFPDGAIGEHLNCGIRIHGNLSRIPDYRKFSFRLAFKDVYGPAKWRYPIFGSYSNAIDEFDDLALRANGQEGWVGIGMSAATYLKDTFARETLLAMGGAASHARWFHLYLNGLYWGMYEMVERPDNSFSSVYFGGEKDNWDALTSIAWNDYHALVGDLSAWNKMLDLCKSNLAINANYMLLQGKNADGIRNPALTNYLDVDSLIDYFILNLYVGTRDWPEKNWWAGRERTNTSTGFKFYPWDADFSLQDVNQNNTAVSNGVAVIYSACRQNAEFQVQFGDHVQRHFFNGGALYVDPQNSAWDPSQPERNIPAWRFVRLCESIQQAIVGESARWGDVHTNAPYTRDNEWATVKKNLLNNYFPQRHAIVLQQLRTVGLFPGIDAPIFNRQGGDVVSGFNLIITNPNAGGTTFCMLDGTDPRLLGGAVNPAAVAYDAPLVLNQTTDVRARVRVGESWSALTAAIFRTPQDLTRLVITEIMYNPPAFSVWSGDELEFLELKNIGTNTLSLGGLAFTAGIDFTFPIGTLLAPGQFFVLARNTTAFQSKYPGVVVNGSYSGKLDNSGETIRLSTLLTNAVLSITYNDRAPWPLAADGYGFSAVPLNSAAPDNSDNGLHWRASAALGGSPGADDPELTVAPIVINEILTRAEAPQLNEVELFNPTAAEMDIGGWFLSDDATLLRKFRIPNGTMIPAGGYVVFTESDFNPLPPTALNFTLDSTGESLYLSAGDAATNLIGYVHAASFGAPATGVSFGRYVNSVGDEHFPAQLATTWGATNIGPSTGPIVISEIMYHPDSDADEFVELRNITTNDVALFDVAHPTNTWRINGIAFTFPTNVVLSSNKLALLVATNPAAFRAKYFVPPDIPVFGPFAGELQDSGERLELQRPELFETNRIAYVTVDAVRYNDRVPWPPSADGGGASLQRRTLPAYGNDPINWDGATPSPGTDFIGGDAPIVLVQPQNTITVLGSNVVLTSSVTGAPPFRYQWRLNGDPIAGATNTTLNISNVQTSQSGTYRVDVVNAAGSATSLSATLTVLLPVRFAAQPMAQNVLPGTNVTMAAAVVGNGTVHYQWRLEGTNLPGATNASYSFTNASLANHGSYSVVASDAFSTAISSNAFVFVLVRPGFIQQPQPRIVLQGQSAAFSAVATGAPPISYRWLRGGVPYITNITGVLLLTNCQSTASIRASAINLSTGPSGVSSATVQLTVLADFDGDGMADDWERQFGFDTNNVADALLDLDGDTMNNRGEYIAGTDPTNAASYLKLEPLEIGGGAIVSFSAVAGHSYSIEFTDATGTGTWLVLTNIAARTTNYTEQVLDPNFTMRRFYRLVTPSR